MSINAKKKGSRVELLNVKDLQELGIKSAHRTQQYCGQAGTSDIQAPEELPNQHIESKGTRDTFITKSILLKWWYQIHEDATSDTLTRKHPNAVPAIIFRANGKRPVVLLPMKSVEILEGNYDILICNVDESFYPVRELDKAEDMDELMRTIQGIKAPPTVIAIAYRLDIDKVLIAVELGTWVNWALKYESRIKADK